MSFIVLSVLGAVMVCPVTDGTVGAEGADIYAATKARLIAKPMISISLPTALDVEIIPKSNGSFNYINTELQVATNNTSGYELLINSIDTTDMVSMDKSNTRVVNALDGAATPETFTNNTWGYYFGEMEPVNSSVYQATSIASTRLYYTDTASAVNTYNLAFGAKIDATLPAGTYANAVVISAVANPLTISSLGQLVYMQDMSSEICENSEIGVTKRLIDTRDGNAYWVTKLADDNCWMTQNLAFNLSTARTVRSADSDVTADWNPTSSTNAVVFDGRPVDSSLTSQYSWNLGKIVLATPIRPQSCNNYGGDGFSSAVSTDNLGEVCRSVGFVDVSGSEWQPIFTAQPGIFNGESQALVAVDEVNHTYDAHYLIGNYYSWNAVTAGSGEDVTVLNAVAPDSVCPKGWMLPASGRNSSNQPIANPNQDKASFYQLLKVYGYPETGGYTLDVNYTPYFQIRNASVVAEDNPASSPISFLRSGSVSFGVGHLRAAGNDARYWSSTSVSNSHAYGFNLTSALEYPATTYGRDSASPVRCVAR